MERRWPPFNRATFCVYPSERKEIIEAPARLEESNSSRRAQELKLRASPSKDEPSPFSAELKPRPEKEPIASAYIKRKGTTLPALEEHPSSIKRRPRGAEVEDEGDDLKAPLF